MHKSGMLLLMMGVLGGLSACQEKPNRVQKKALSELVNIDESGRGQGGTMDVVILYPDKESANQDKKENLAEGVSREELDDEGRLVRVSGSSDEIKDILVSERARVAHNSTFKIRSRAYGAALKTSAEGPQPLDLLTVRSVVGISQLLEAHPGATGEGKKVAVFDTGIDFGVKGLSEVVNGSSRLKGFFDFSGFGRVESKPLPELAFRQSDLPVLDESIQARNIDGYGELSEVELGKAYFTNEPIDLNGNGTNDDVFQFLTGINQDGVRAVWIDADQNQRIDSRILEELTSYNSTFKYINMQLRDEMEGVHSLAVTIGSENQLQFHTVPHGHGTSCALIIGGDGYGDGSLKGLAPDVSFVSYTLDVTGQDVYTMDEFIRMFLHARSQGVDAISISWGFSTANLQSARWFSEFLDQEIASKGIVIGIAAGNDGPGVGSAAPDDYIPHNGFGVGAYLSKDQAVNVYGWIGTQSDAVVGYSSFGPTRGGRQMPDVVSPIISMVRGERSGNSDPFYGFSGTSSATPALIGAVMALASAFPGEEKPDARLLKLAVLNSAEKVPATLKIRQGSGLIRVDKAFGHYQKYLAEQKAAEADRSRKSRFAYGLVAQTDMINSAEKGEGIYLHKLRNSGSIQLFLDEKSKALVDPFYFMEPLVLEQEHGYLELPQVVTLQASGARIAVKFNEEKLKQRSGVYSDILKVKRAYDGEVLLQLPVVLQLSDAEPDEVVASVSETLTDFGLWRMPVSLSEPTAIKFQGMISAPEGYQGARFYFYIRAHDGHVSHGKRVSLSGPFTPVQFESSVLPQGNYELIVSRNYGRPAVVAPASLMGHWTLPKLRLRASELSDQELNVVLEARSMVQGQYWALEVTGTYGQVNMEFKPDGARPGYYGRLELPYESDSLEIGLRQSKGDRFTSGMLHMSLAMSDPDSLLTMFRGWIDVQDELSPLDGIAFGGAVKSLDLMAYPNIVNWNTMSTKPVGLAWKAPVNNEISAELKVAGGVSLNQGDMLNLKFKHTDFSEGQELILKLVGSGGELVEQLTLRL